MEIHNIKDTSDNILKQMDKLANKDCQPGDFSLIELREMVKNTDVLYLLDEGRPIFFLLLDIFTKQKMLYIHDVCVSKSHRGKGLFKKSLPFLKEHYLAKGYTKFTLDASDSTKEEGLDQKARIHIFHSAGFDINTETGYFTGEDYKIMKTKVLLDNKDVAEIQGKKGDVYYVENKKGDKYEINIERIEKCLDAKLNPISCPMIMYLSSNGGKRKTRKARVTRKKFRKHK
jgi:GNAT superfamily N-acetyltransferase